jgi:hypothetical protein
MLEEDVSLSSTEENSTTGKTTGDSDGHHNDKKADESEDDSYDSDSSSVGSSVTTDTSSELDDEDDDEDPLEHGDEQYETTEDDDEVPRPSMASLNTTASSHRLQRRLHGLAARSNHSSSSNCTQSKKTSEATTSTPPTTQTTQQPQAPMVAAGFAASSIATMPDYHIMDEDAKSFATAGSAGSTSVAKLRQGRLDARSSSFHVSSSATSVASSSNGDSACCSLAGDDISTAGGVPTHAGTTTTTTWNRLPATKHTAALLFADISGFTKLSTSLAVEPFSKARTASIVRVECPSRML